jgi:dTDP-4-dehydrorhamnose 3,5-epimerase
LIVAEGCATGFLTLVDETIVHYQMGDVYRPEGDAGIRYDDPAIGVVWPAPPAVISARDAAFGPLDHSGERS